MLGAGRGDGKVQIRAFNWYRRFALLSQIFKEICACF